MKEKILYITFKACEGKDFFILKNKMQYENAIGLISINIILHVLQLGGLIVIVTGLDIMPITEYHVLIFLLLAVTIFLVSSKLFSRRILAKAIAKYKNQKIRNCRLIAFGYLAFNLTLTVFISYLSSSLLPASVIVPSA